MSADWLRLNGMTGLGNPLVAQQIQDNLISFFTWGFLEAGGFTNIRLPTSGTYGGDKSRLRLASDARYTAGQVWETFQKPLVWESGVQNYTPIAISGVWVNNTFYPSNTSGAYAHKINYPDGRIIFTTAVATGSKVQCEYSYKIVKFVPHEDEEFAQVLTELDRVDNSQYSTPGSGQWSISAQNKVTLPIVGIGTSPRFNLTPKQLGGGQVLHQDINFIVLAESAQMRNQIMDAVRYQKEKTIRMYDTNLAPRALNYDGTISSGAMTYPNLVTATPSGYFNKTCYFENITGSDLGHINRKIYGCSIRATLYIEMDEI